jgi:hypothetical protein
MINRNIIHIHLSEVTEDIASIMNDLYKVELYESRKDKKRLADTSASIFTSLLHASWRLNQLTHEHDKSDEEIKATPEETITKWRKQTRDSME